MKTYEGSVLVSLGDSLAFPLNDQFSECAVENTWVQLAFTDSTLRSLWFRNSRGSTSKHVLDELGRVIKHLPELSSAVFVVQCGIVDCTPRPLPRRVFFVLKQFFPRGLARCSFLYSIWGKPWVSIRKFRINMESLFRRISSHPSYETGGIIVIGIQDPGPNLTKITGNFSVSEYNSILIELVGKLERAFYVGEELKIHPDGHHLASESHLKLASAVTDALDGLGFSKKPT